jgi:methyl-accepting chemotaxis protein
MGLLLLALSVEMVAGALGTWRAADRLSGLTTTSRVLFKTLVATRLERAMQINTILADPPADSAAQTRIARQREISESAYAESGPLLARVSTAGLSTALDRVRAAHESMAQLRTRADAAILKPKAQRDPALPHDYPQGSGAYLDAVNTFADTLDSSLRLADPLVDQLLTLKQTTWAARSSLASILLRCSASVATGHGWEPAQILSNAEDSGRVAALWAEVRQIAARPEIPPAVVKAVGEADKLFAGPMADERKALVEALSRKEAVAVTQAQFDERNLVQLNLFTDLLNSTMDEMINRAIQQERSAMATLVRSVLEFAVAVVLLIVGLLVIQRRVSRPLLKMSDAMRRLAEHDMAVEIPGIGRADEVGAMAEAVQVLKENTIRADSLASQQKEAQQAREARTRAIESLTGDFDHRVSGVLDVVTSALTKLNAAAETMTENSEQTTRQAGSVAASADQASSSVQTVASAAEELSAAIKEIGHQVEQSNQASRAASERAARTHQTVLGLAESSAKIDNVIKLINDIAGRTNLLALNATIEAARAGDAGKGFAVVAGEVKGLANQTAKATEEISSQIAAVQAATEDAVTAIDDIVARIEEINAIATAIASSVEEQSAATGEIARNIQHAASGTQDISAGIASVTRAAGGTGEFAGQVLSAAHSVATEANGLKDTVGQFLESVRTA